MKTKKTEIKIIADPADEIGLSKVHIWLNGKLYAVTYTGVDIGTKGIIVFLRGLAEQDWWPIEKLATKQASRKSTAAAARKGKVLWCERRGTELAREGRANRNPGRRANANA
jgi:hypothetical protein